MKVISGKLKGRNIIGYNIDGTRPTMDRVKESIFGTIQFYIEGSIVLDLFAGSGALGIEAISNGSKKVYFNDISKKAVDVIKTNISNFNIQDDSVVLNMDYNKCLSFLKEEKIKFNIVFLDPPYSNKILNEVIEYILKKDMLCDDAIIVCEVQNDYINSNSHLDVLKKKKYGDKEVLILQKKGL